MCGRLLKTTRIDSHSAAFVGTARSMGQDGFLDAFLCALVASQLGRFRSKLRRDYWPFEITSVIHGQTHTFLQPLCHFVQKKTTSYTSKFKSWTEKTWRLLFVLVVLPISCFQGGGFPRASQAAVTCLEVASDCSADVSMPKHQHRGLGHSTPEMVWTTESPWRHQGVCKVFVIIHYYPSLLSIIIH